MLKRLFLCILLFPAFASAVEVTQWQAIPGKSTINWEATYGTQKIKGELNEFTSEIAFDPESLEHSKIKITIDLTKIKTDESNAKSMLPGKEWFDVAEYPVATFETTKISAASSQTEVAKKSYIATATLILHGKTMPISLPFTLTVAEDKKTATAEGKVVLKRLDFDVGTGEWQDTAIIANEVTVSFHIEALSNP